MWHSNIFVDMPHLYTYNSHERGMDMEIKERLKKIRKSLHLTQQEFADKLGIKRNTVATYETGKSNPSDSAVVLICRVFDVREEWLRTGQGEMFRPKSANVLEQLAEEYHLSDTAYIMVEKFINLSPQAQNEIFNYINDVVTAIQNRNTVPGTKKGHQPEETNRYALELFRQNFPDGVTEESVPPEPKKPSTKELEEEYKKRISNSAQSMDFTASDTTKGTGIQSVSGK